jgi:hypothetical protein
VGTGNHQGRSDRQVDPALESGKNQGVADEGTALGLQVDVRRFDDVKKSVDQVYRYNYILYIIGECVSGARGAGAAR